MAILTISDSAVAGTRKDVSGPALRAKCEELGWPITEVGLVADEVSQISDILRTWADGRIATLILTTGGTGVAPRDVTPEATRAILDREIPGMAELMRSKGREQTRFSVLSRAVAGSRKETLIVNLPGSPAGAIHSLHQIENLVGHVVQLLAGDTEHLAETKHLDAKLETVIETHGEVETSE